jgi:hypothetical protein
MLDWMAKISALVSVLSYFYPDKAALSQGKA